jgi:hypothetical protein
MENMTIPIERAGRLSSKSVAAHDCVVFQSDACWRMMRRRIFLANATIIRMAGFYDDPRFGNRSEGWQRGLRGRRF